MAYVGLQHQIKTNRRKSILLLMAFPLLVLAMVFFITLILTYNPEDPNSFNLAMEYFIGAIPMTLLIVGIWFVIAYFGNTAMVNSAANSHSISRKENMRIYNLTENLCMSVGMKMPQLRVIESSALNAFASGINDKTYTVTLTTGIIDALTDDELEGVIAHELMHIRNHDVRLLIVSIIFVGIFSFIMQIAVRSLFYNSAFSSRRNNNDKGGGAILIIAVIVVAAIAYFLSFLFKLALSRKREYMADSGAVEMTRNADGLARALEKISGRSNVEEVTSDDVKQMFIENDPREQSKGFLGGLGGLFSTHPPIEKRIQFLRQL